MASRGHPAAEAGHWVEAQHETIALPSLKITKIAWIACASQWVCRYIAAEVELMGMAQYVSACVQGSHH